MDMRGGSVLFIYLDIELAILEFISLTREYRFFGHL